MTTLFYAPPQNIQDNTYLVLPEEEASHAVRVLRKQRGNEIQVVDGEGGWYRVQLDHVDKRTTAGKILEKRQDVGEPAYELSMGVALLKNRNRFETFLEKAVELGVQGVIPMTTARTEKATLNLKRSRRLLIAAMKQCGRSRLLNLQDPEPFSQVIENPADLSLLCHERVGIEYGIAEILAQHQASSVQILVGPEGGFTEEEVEQAQHAGYQATSLGPRRLRAETAAIVAASAMLMHR